jgi:predicted MFS family arabinose efflux permease
VRIGPVADSHDPRRGARPPRLEAQTASAPLEREAPAHAAAGATDATGGNLIRLLVRHRSFSALWWGQLVSILGERLTYLALIGLLSEHTARFRDPRSSLLLSLLANVMLAPVLLLSPFTGAWVDRWNLKRVLVVSDLLRSGLVLLIPVVYHATHQIAPVLALVFALFTCNVFFLPAKSAITPELVPAPQLLAANALLVSAGIAATAAGALSGGWIIDHWGWARACTMNGVTYLISVIALLLIVYHPETHAVSLPVMSWRRYLGEIAEGWSVVRSNATVGLALIALAAVWVGGGFLHVAGNQHIQRAASAPGMKRLGMLLFVLGVGSGIGTWWINTYGRRWPRPVLLGGGLALAGAGLAAFAVSTRFAVFAAVALVVGFAAAPAFMLSETMLQEGIEPRRRGRVFSVRDFLMRLVFLLGVTSAGWSSRALGLKASLLFAAALMAGAGVLAFAWGRTNPELMRTTAGAARPGGRP